MSRIYNDTNKIKLTDIPDRYNVPKRIKGNQAKFHATIVTYISNKFHNTRKFKQSVVDAINLLTYVLLTDEISIVSTWRPASPLETLPEFDRELVENALGDLFLTIESIEWNLPENYSMVSAEIDESETENPDKSSIVSSNISNQSYNPIVSNQHMIADTVLQATPKTDLYIQSPVVPQFDISKPWLSTTFGHDQYVIYTTLPEVPTKQNEISITTDIGKMNKNDFMKIFPNVIIKTRAPALYEQFTDASSYDNVLGYIPHISGYTQDQIIDNIIRYPHLYRLSRKIDDELVSFYSSIEIENQLHPTLEIWDSLEDAKFIPKQPEYIKDYVVRRYLLERDINKIHHKYPLYGELDEYLTLFMPPSEYITRGYKDVEELARKCVRSRIRYKQSRNPIMRRLDIHV